MSAVRLREAAALMREWAAICHPSNPDWHVVKDRFVVTPINGLGNEDRVIAEGMASYDAAHIASWHPAGGVAVADWVDAAAAREESGLGKDAPAYLLADAYLGGPS